MCANLILQEDPS